jgi:hypothetical protein
MEIPEKLEPILLENDEIWVHPFRNMDVYAIDLIAQDIFEIFSDPLVLKYSPEKIIKSLQEAYQYSISKNPY